MALFADLGLARGGRLFLHYGKRPECFADLLAIWSLGACAVPIDSRMTAFEVEPLAAAARPRLSVWEHSPDGKLAEALGKLGVAIAPVEETRGGAHGEAPRSRIAL